MNIFIQSLIFIKAALALQILCSYIWRRFYPCSDNFPYLAYSHRILKPFFKTVLCVSMTNFLNFLGSHKNSSVFASCKISRNKKILSLIYNIYLSDCLSVCVYIYLCVCMPDYLSIYLCAFVTVCLYNSLYGCIPLQCGMDKKDLLTSSSKQSRHVSMFEACFLCQFG